MNFSSADDSLLAGESVKAMLYGLQKKFNGDFDCTQEMREIYS